MNEGKNIQGNVNVSRNANVGGNMSVRGDGVVGHNLVVKGWLDAPNIKGPLKGLFASEGSLRAAYPLPMPGWYALVGNTLPAQVWRVERGKWVATGETGGEFNLWLDQLESDVRDLTEEVDGMKEVLDNGVLIGDGIEFTSTGSAAAMTFVVMKRDGSVVPYSKSIPLVDDKVAGMMSAEDKRLLSGLSTSFDSLKSNTNALQGALEKEVELRSESIDELKLILNKLRRDFDTLCGENASDAIDNFNEIIAFLDGITDRETLASKFADLAMQNAGISGAIQDLSMALSSEVRTREEEQVITNRQLSSLERKTSPIIVCDGILESDQIPTRPGVFLQRDDEGDIVQVVESGTELVRSLPAEGKFYMCGELLYMFNGIMLEPVGRSHFVFDGGMADTVFSDRSPVIGGGEPNSDLSIAKVYDGGVAK